VINEARQQRAVSHRLALPDGPELKHDDEDAQNPESDIPDVVADLAAAAALVPRSDAEPDDEDENGLGLLPALEEPPVDKDGPQPAKRRRRRGL
jgi:hypothetical protein